VPLMAESTRDRSEGVIENYLIPVFGEGFLTSSMLPLNLTC
jgi:hypothetical protein